MLFETLNVGNDVGNNRTTCCLFVDIFMSSIMQFEHVKDGNKNKTINI